jgi:hypothetical protein
MLLLLAPVSGASADAEAEPAHHPTWLGRSQAELRDEFGSALQPAKIEVRRGPSQQIPIPKTKASDSEGKPSPQPIAPTKNPFAEQQRFALQSEAEGIDRVEFELFRDLVYRVRWKLAERFERPVMPSLVEHLTADLGKPYYDQTIEGKFGSGRATMRRTGWKNEDRNLEVRQLNPMVGGLLFLTVSDLGAIQEIIASGGTAAPEPDSIGPWWQKAVKPLPPVTPPERKALLDAFHVVLARVGWRH